MAGAWESNVAANQVGSAFSFFVFVFVFSLLISIVGGISNQNQPDRKKQHQDGGRKQTNGILNLHALDLTALQHDNPIWIAIDRRYLDIDTLIRERVF